MTSIDIEYWYHIILYYIIYIILYYIIFYYNIALHIILYWSYAQRCPVMSSLDTRVGEETAPGWQHESTQPVLLLADSIPKPIFFGMKGWNHQPFSRGNYIISAVKGRCVVSSSFILIPSYQCNHNLYERTLALDGLRLFDYWLAAPVISMKSGGDTSFFLVDSLIPLINKGALVKRVTMWSHVARLFMVVQTSVGTRSYSLILGVTAGLRCSPWKRCFLSSLAPCCFPKAHDRPASLKRDGNASTYYIENMTRTNWQTMPMCLMGTCIFIQ